MANPIYPCLWFDGKGAEAAAFYCSIFKNSKILSTSPMVVNFSLQGFKVMALDGGPQFKINPSISLFVNCESVAETERIWNKLIENGKELMPLGKYDWSEKYGWLQDKFGMTWQLSVVSEEGVVSSIRPSMLFTSEHFGEAEEAITHYTSIFKESEKEVMIPYPKGDANAGKVLFSEFTLNKVGLIAMDGPGEHGYTFNEAVSFVVECDDQKEIDYYWNSLTEGGAESQCGWLRDKFGVFWQIVPKVLSELMSDPKRAQRVVQAFLPMKKLIIEKLIEA